MSSSHGKFCWYELVTTDQKGAEAFYKAVVGWRMKDAGMPGMAYTILSAGDVGVGGLMTLPAEALKAGARPGWMGYIVVDNVDEYAKRVTQAGGSIHKQPQDIPTVGRFSVVADPDGVPFVLFKPLPADSPPPVKAGTPGHTGWHELHAGNWEKAFAFYAGLFGWTKDQAMDMGPMGVYQIFKTGGDPVGGMMTKTPDMPSPCWLYYFNVDAIDAAVTRIKSNGGKILLEPHQVPGGSWIVQGLDPQGAMFSLVAPQR